MAHQLSHRSCSPAVLRLILVLVGICLVGYTVGPPLYWHFTERLRGKASCPPCVCDCSAESVLSLPLGGTNSSLQDCSGHDPNMSEEMQKTFADLLTEELKLNEDVALDRQEHAAAAILEAKKTSSQYQKEAEKCNTGMETCEEARERAEAALRAELKLSALWESRARKRGWMERRAAS